MVLIGTNINHLLTPSCSIFFKHIHDKKSCLKFDYCLIIRFVLFGNSYFLNFFLESTSTCDGSTVILPSLDLHYTPPQFRVF